MVHVMSYKIEKPINTDWNTFKFVYNVIQKEMMQIQNRTIQMCNTMTNESNSINRTAIYRKLINDFPISQRLNLNQASQKAFKKYKQYKFDIIDGNISIPSFKNTIPIEIHNKSIKIKQIKENKKYNTYELTLSFISNKGLPLLNQQIEEHNKNIKNDKYKIQNIKDKRFVFLINAYKGSQLDIITRCLTQAYKICASELILRKDKNGKKKKYYFNLSYNFESEKLKLDPTNVMGIDVGKVVPAYMAFSFNKYLRDKIDDDSVCNLKNQIDNRLSRLKHSRKFALDGSKGHGRKTLMNIKSKLNHYSYNLQKTKDHNWSAYIVKSAINHGCGTIAMENLSKQNNKESKSDNSKIIKMDKTIKNSLRDSTESDKWLRNWSFYQLQHDIEYKAREKGLYVIYVDPYQTSQKCSECGYVNKKNRPEKNESGHKDQSYFKCLKCGYKDNADFNAARNITKIGEIEINKILNSANLK